MARVQNGLYHVPLSLTSLARNDKGELLLVMEPGVELSGRLALDDGIDPKTISVSAWNQAGGNAPSRTDVYGWSEVMVQPNGAFRVAGLAPGLYTIRAGIGNKGDTAVFLTDVDSWLEKALFPA